MPRKARGPQVKYRKERQCWEVIEYTGGKRKRHATDLCSREAAQEALVEVLSAKPIAGEIDTVGQAMAYYIEHQAPNTARPDNIEQIAMTIAPFWGEVRIPEINKAVCQSYAAKRNDGRKKKLSNATIRKEIEQVQAAVNFARENGKVFFAPVFWKPDPPPAKDRWLTGREAAKLLRAARSMPDAKGYLPLFILIGLYTSARSEAILSLRWNQVDFKRRQIDFRPGQRSDNKKRSVVPIPPRLMRALVAAKDSDIGYVINRNGKPIARVKKGFAAAVLKAGLKGVTPHTLRHTAISWAVQKGIPTSKVARWAGHSTSVMVERVYGHMAPEHLDEIAESFGGKYEVSAPETAPNGKTKPAKLAVSH